MALFNGRSFTVIEQRCGRDARSPDRRLVEPKQIGDAGVLPRRIRAGACLAITSSRTSAWRACS